MARAKRLSRYDADGTVQELVRNEFLDYVQIVYLLADGPLEDPATTVVHRTAIFNAGDEPPDEAAFQKAWDESKKTYYGSGVTGALLDDEIAYKKEGDYDADHHRQESESLLEKGSQPRWGEKTTYEQFLTAIDKVADDDGDEESWNIIDLWRQRQLRNEERSTV